MLNPSYPSSSQVSVHHTIQIGIGNQGESWIHPGGSAGIRYNPCYNPQWSQLDVHNTFLRVLFNCWQVLYTCLHAQGADPGRRQLKGKQRHTRGGFPLSYLYKLASWIHGGLFINGTGRHGVWVKSTWLNQRCAVNDKSSVRGWAKMRRLSRDTTGIQPRGHSSISLFEWCPGDRWGTRPMLFSR